MARDREGRLVAPEDARKRAAYRCPSCQSPVDLHAGEKKRRHFHHRAAGCSSESVTHASAKYLVAQAVADWLDGEADSPRVVRCCARADCDRTTRQSLPPKVRAVEVEHRLPTGRVVDVALLAVLARGETTARMPIAAVEVHQSHAVDGDKRAELPVPRIEVEATAVCASLGRELVPVQDRFLPWFCEEHGGERGRALREERAETRALRAAVARLPYRPADFPAFRVAGLARCSRGHEGVVWGWDGGAAPFPRPPHVVARSDDEDWRFDRAQGRGARVLGFRRRYVSVCPSCGEELPAP